MDGATIKRIDSDQSFVRVLFGEKAIENQRQSTMVATKKYTPHIVTLKYSFILTLSQTHEDLLAPKIFIPFHRVYYIMMCNK